MKQLILRLLIPMTLMTGCSKAPEQDPVVAIVNGEKIFKSNLIEFLPPQSRDQDIAPYFDRLRERAIHVELALKKAIQEVKADDPELKDKLAEIKDDVLLDRYRHALKAKHANDDKLKETYKKFIKDNPSQTEIRARHILVESEEEAKAALEKVNSGTDFGDHADAISKDKGKGGDLGYFRAADMVKPFSEKAYALRDSMAKRLKSEDFTENTGERGIVQSDFGWHVIEVLGSRISSHPPMEEMRDTLEGNAMKEVIDKVTDELRKEKNVKMYNLDGTPYEEGYKLDPAKKLDNDQVLVEIADKKYTKKDLLALIPNATPDSNIQPFYDRLITEFVKKELLREEARKVVSLNDPEVKRELDIITHRLIVNLYLEREVQKQLKDADMQELYKEYLAKNPPVDEVHARHILVETEDEAKEVIKLLEKGADFGEVAMEKSKDKASGTGDLGFFRFEDMVPEFSKAAFALKPTVEGQKPEYGLAKSAFGWHVIELLERRKTKQPTFEKAKELLHPQASQKIVDNLLVGLKEAAEVELFDLPSNDKKEDKKA